MPSNEYILGNEYLFTEGTGTSVNDTADGNDITLTGSPNWVTGRVGGYAVEFTGAATQYGEGAVNWTTTGAGADPRLNAIYYWLTRIWFKTSSASGRALWGIKSPSGENPCCYVGTDGKLHALFTSTITDSVLVTAGKTVTDAEWHELVVAHCGGSSPTFVSSLYLDAEYIGGGTGDGIAHSNSAAKHRIGGGLSIPSSFLGAHGTPSDTAGWTGILGSVEVFWWNGSVCTGNPADKITWTPSRPPNAIMFSCNT